MFTFQRVLLAAVVAVIGAPATAQTTADDDAVVARYANAYQKAGKPRVAVFWNRDFSDRTHANARVVQRTQGSIHDNSTVTRTYGEGASTRQRTRAGGFEVSSSQGTEFDAAAQRRTSLSESELWQVETEFTKRLIDGGTRVIDRAAIVRTTAPTSGRDAASADPQALETTALVGKADLLLEVLLTADSSAPLGWAFRSNLKDIKTGRVLSSGYYLGVPKVVAEPARYEARAGGFELVTPPAKPISAQAVGHALAVEAMGELTLRMTSR